MTAEATPETKFSISIQLDGFPVTVEFMGNAKKLREVVTILKNSGATPPPVRSFGGGGSFGKKDNLTDPAFDGDGQEICPIHKKPVRSYTTKDGRTFKGCPSSSTGAAGETLNDRGYCSLRFR
jgi:hypothetical protein